MKKAILLFCVLGLGSLVSSCGFDDPIVEYPEKSVLFTYQNYKRELVVGEGLKFKLGVVFAGLEKSDRDRKVKYVIDETLIPAGKTLLPAEYYSAANASEIIVPKGDLKGYVQFQMDSLKFISDPKSLTGEYVLPFRIVEADADKITEGKDYMVLSLKYLAKQFGYYEYKGSRTPEGGEEEKYNNVATDKTSYRELVTVGPSTLRMKADAFANGDPLKAAKVTMLLEVAPLGGTAVTISADPTSPVAVEPAGESTYDPATHTFVLNYKYTVSGTTYTASDKLTFRNRIRDDQGNKVQINEWQIP